MISEAQKVEIHVHIWDEGEEHVITDWDGNFAWERISALMEEKLATKEFGAIMRTYPDGQEIGLYYRAFTDEHRGRMICGGGDPADTNKNFEHRKAQCAQKVFTPSELYALKPVRIEFDSYSVVIGFLHEEIDSYDFDHAEADKLEKVEYRELVFREEWALGSVWFDGKPVMVVNQWGKDCENRDRWITDASLYGEMVQWLDQFVRRSEITGFVKASSIIPALTEFGGSSIHDFYDVEQQQQKKN